MPDSGGVMVPSGPTKPPREPGLILPAMCKNTTFDKHRENRFTGDFGVHHGSSHPIFVKKKHSVAAAVGTIASFWSSSLHSGELALHFQAIAIVVLSIV